MNPAPVWKHGTVRGRDLQAGTGASAPQRDGAARTNPPLRVGIPTRGRLHTPVLTALTDAGYTPETTTGPIQFGFLHARDIATLLDEGRLEAGFTGRDILTDTSTTARELLALPGTSTELRWAAPCGTTDISQLDGTTVATSYPHLTQQSARTHGITITLLPVKGATENAAALHIAHAVVESVHRGGTLARIGFEPIGERILHSEVILARTATPLGPIAEQALTDLGIRLRTVLGPSTPNTPPENAPIDC